MFLCCGKHCFQHVTALSAFRPQYVHTFTCDDLSNVALTTLLFRSESTMYHSHIDLEI